MNGERTRNKTRFYLFIWEAGQSAIETIIKGECNTDPDTINTERPKQLLKDY